MKIKNRGNKPRGKPPPKVNATWTRKKGVRTRENPKRPSRKVTSPNRSKSTRTTKAVKQKVPNMSLEAQPCKDCIIKAFCDKVYQKWRFFKGVAAKIGRYHEEILTFMKVVTMLDNQLRGHRLV